MDTFLYPNQGTLLKINVHVDAPGGYAMDDFDFSCDFFCVPSKPVTVKKAAMKRIDAGNYVALVDTTNIGTGALHCKVTALIPDEDCDSGVRPEIATAYTGITVKP